MREILKQVRALSWSPKKRKTLLEKEPVEMIVTFVKRQLCIVLHVRCAQ